MPELKHTKQRMAILKFLTSQPDPATAEDIFRALHSDFPNLAAFYNLSQLRAFYRGWHSKKRNFYGRDHPLLSLTRTRPLFNLYGCDRKIRLVPVRLLKWRRN